MVQIRPICRRTPWTVQRAVHRIYSWDLGTLEARHFLELAAEKRRLKASFDLATHVNALRAVKASMAGSMRCAERGVPMMKSEALTAPLSSFFFAVKSRPASTLHQPGALSRIRWIQAEATNGTPG